MPELPTSDAISRCLALIGWDRVSFDSSSIVLPTPGMEIDMGGIGKEYIADAVVACIKRFDICHGIVNLGGDIAVVLRGRTSVPVQHR